MKNENNIALFYYARIWTLLAYKYKLKIVFASST